MTIESAITVLYANLFIKKFIVRILLYVALHNTYCMLHSTACTVYCTALHVLCAVLHYTYCVLCCTAMLCTYSVCCHRPHRYELRELVDWFLRVMRKGPGVEGSEATVMDMKYNPLPLIKAKFNERLPSFPINFQTTEKLERVR